MARYIDAVECADAISEELKIPLGDLVDVFAEIPTADVVEVKNAEWITEFAKLNTPKLTGEDSTVIYRCSRCGRYESRKEPYCNCGAKMDGGEKHDGSKSYRNDRRIPRRIPT